MRHPEFPVISFLMVPLLLSSLPSHIRARSIATISLLAWLVVLNIIRGVNSLIWANNIIVKAEVWCDISTKIVIGFTFAVPLAALCICRHLEHVSSNRQAIITEADKTRRMKFEAVMCFGLPIIFMALHYIVQGHRFDLIEDVGCYPSTYFSLPAVIIIWVPPLVISLISLVYAVAAFHHFLQRRVEFAAILRSSNSAISPARYFRLMALAMFEILWDSGTNIYILYYNTFTGLRPWISWENVHSNFSRVALFPQFILPSWAIVQLVWQWWIIPISSIAFFVFFGFGEEAMSDYRSAIIWCRRTILCQAVKPGDLFAPPAVLPVHRYASHDIEVVLPTLTDDASASEHEKKAWDELSRKLPVLPQHPPHPQSVESSFNGHDSFLHQETPLSSTAQGSEHSFLPSPDDVQGFSIPPDVGRTAHIPDPSPRDVSFTAPSRTNGSRSSSPDPSISISQTYPSSADEAFQ